MKTLTEFSTLMLRKAAAARATVPLDQATPHASPAATDSSGAEQASAGDDPAESATDDRAAANADTTVEAAAEGAIADEAPADEAPADEVPDAEAAAGEAAEGEPVQAAVPAPHYSDATVQAVASACGVQSDRATRLLEALDIVGRDIDRVRLVRVYQGEKGPHNAISRGEFHYVVDRVAGPAGNRRETRGGRGGERSDRGGGGAGGSFSGGDRKPRGLGSLKFGAAVEAKDPKDDRPGRGEMPRAGIGWQLTSTPRSFDDAGRGGRGPRGRGPGGRGPGGRGPGGRGPGGRGPGGRGPGGRGPGGRGPGGRGPGQDRGFRDPQSSPIVTEASGSGPVQAAPPRAPRLGPDGQPLPPRSKRPRKPMGPDEKGLGPDGTPWDPERRAKRLADQNAKLNTVAKPNVEMPPSPPPAPTPAEKTD